MIVILGYGKKYDLLYYITLPIKRAVLFFFFVLDPERLTQ
ncbi:hypothetical protein II5_05903 [Bacillus cereus MSX-A1]|nr:hypothetical protein II5_05903 [Bacillus cereus MSX-A1]